MSYNHWSARIREPDTNPRVESISDRDESDEGETTDPVHQLLSRWAHYQEASDTEAPADLFERIQHRLKR